jgi:CheY-like chemotaxis protein
VLLVEDNDLVRDFAESLLADIGYRVIGVGSADEALAALDREPVDLLLSDIVMPGMNGIELARRVHARDPALPVLLASGYSEDVLNGAAVDFSVIAKPYSPAELAAAIGGALGPAAQA